MPEIQPATRASVITLGTCGGPKWRLERAGISSAVIIGESIYLVDFGYGAGRQVVAAGLDLSQLRAGFVTHLHSDHISDLANLLLYGWYHGLGDVRQPVTLVGPGSRGTVPAVADGREEEPQVVCPDHAEPGFADTLSLLIQAYATDINDRLRDNARPHPHRVLRAFDIDLPSCVPFHPDRQPAPPMEAFQVYADENTVVTATLVEHAPMAPAYAFRFDTDEGSVVFSGDTAPCENLIKMASGADVLVHEVIDEQWVANKYADQPAPVKKAMMGHHLTAHTSISDVGRVAQRAGVGTLVLTHFVPGDRNPGRWHEAGDNFDGRLVVANDLDRIAITRAR